MWAETRTVPIISEEGNEEASLSIMLDVTGAYRYQCQVEERNRDLQDFAYMITHDLKAPILTVQGMTRIIREDSSSDVIDTIKDPLEHIERASKRLEALVASVLRYARIAAEESNLETVNLCSIIPGAIDDHVETIRKSGASINFPKDKLLVWGDSIKLHQIFSNLIGNALKYRNPKEPPKIDINWKLEGQRLVTISVSDNGLGIPEDKQEHIFRPFHRAHGKEIEGTGIGLACVQQLLRKISGTIRVNSEVEKGSTFTVKLTRSTES